MKQLSLWVSFFLFAKLLFSQNDNGYDVPRYFQLNMNQTAEFYEIDEFRKIQKDTVFEAGEYFVLKTKSEKIIDGVSYLIIEFPDFTGKLQRGKEPKSSIAGSSTGPVYINLSKDYNGKLLCIQKGEFDKLRFTKIYNRKVHLTGGLLTLPFKFRSKVNDTPRSMTTDVTLGPYIGARMRLLKKSDFFLTVPLTAGLTFINVNDSNTNPNNPQSNDNAIVPGFTLGSGLVFQLNKYEIGFIGGWDWGTGKAGSEWIYDAKPWISFAIGYSFLR